MDARPGHADAKPSASYRDKSGICNLCLRMLRGEQNGNTSGEQNGTPCKPMDPSTFATPSAASGMIENCSTPPTATLHAFSPRTGSPPP